MLAIRSSRLAVLTAGVVDVGAAVVCCAVVAAADAVVLAAVRVADDVAAVRSDDVEVAAEAVVAVAFCADVTAVVVTLAGLADVTAAAVGDGLVSVIMLPLSDVGGLGGLSVCANMLIPSTAAVPSVSAAVLRKTAALRRFCSRRELYFLIMLSAISS